MTIQEVADKLRISYASASRLVQSGDLPGFKVGRLWRVRESDFKAFIDGKVRAMGGVQLRLPLDPESEAEDEPRG